MANMTCKLLWKKPISLSRAAKLMSRFAAVDSGATAAISTYVQRSADAFTHLAHFHSKSFAKPPTADSADQSALTIVNAVAGEAAEPKEKKKKRKRSMNDADDVESDRIQKRRDIDP